MKTFFKDDSGNLSMGRLLAFILFFVVTGLMIYSVISQGELTSNTRDLIVYGWGIAIGGKALQKAAENIKK